MFFVLFLFLFLCDVKKTHIFYYSSEAIARIEGVLPLLASSDSSSCCILSTRLMGVSAIMSHVSSLVKSCQVCSYFISTVKFARFHGSLVAAYPRAILASLCHSGRSNNSRTHSVARAAQVGSVIADYHNFSFGSVAVKDVSCAVLLRWKLICRFMSLLSISVNVQMRATLVPVVSCSLDPQTCRLCTDAVMGQAQ